MKPILRRFAAEALTSSPARYLALVIDVLVLGGAYLAARLAGREIEP